MLVQHLNRRGIMLSRTAECVCTALKVTVPGEPAVVVLCNCKQCQKRTGSIFGVSAYFPEQTVSVSGKSKVFTRVSDRGNTVDCHFCPECGTTLFWDISVVPDEPDPLETNRRGVAIGCFADPTFRSPQLVVWAIYQHHWARFPESVPTYNRGPTSE